MRRAIVHHMVDPEADSYQTMCGKLLPMALKDETWSVNFTDVSCLGCWRERQAREVEKRLRALEADEVSPW